MTCPIDCQSDSRESSCSFDIRLLRARPYDTPEPC
jgi:hypothetical protein